MSTHSYDPSQVVISIGGQTVSGFADGTFITVSRNNPTWSLTSGASGETCRAKSNDWSGTIELTLMQSSSMNNFLSAKMLLDELSNNGKFAFNLLDADGTTLVSALECWVQQAPSVEYGKELSDRTWTLETGDLVYTSVGGIMSQQEADSIKTLANSI